MPTCSWKNRATDYSRQPELIHWPKNTLFTVYIHCKLEPVRFHEIYGIHLPSHPQLHLVDFRGKGAQSFNSFIFSEPRTLEKMMAGVGAIF